MAGLRQACPDLPRDAGLAGRLGRAAPRARHTAAGRKVLIVLDQFEQWLHARGGEPHTELAAALRQCDGERRASAADGAGRLLDGGHAVPAGTGSPARSKARTRRAVDLFDPLHARKVLAEFGRAFGRLPENPVCMTAGRRRFLDQAVAGLGGRRQSDLRAAGPVRRHDEGPALDARRAAGGRRHRGRRRDVPGRNLQRQDRPPEHRLHQKAARAVLKALLPDQGTDIKGHMRSSEELLEASGYAGRPEAFADLIRILDREIRLITPTIPQPINLEPDGDSPETLAGSCQPPTLPLRRRSPVRRGDRPRRPPARPFGAGSDPAAPLAPKVSPKLSHASPSYQLTHDYLVPSLREWLTRKQKETRRGLAELRLAERAALWNAKPENRHLPSWWEYLNIRWLVSRKQWTAGHHKMMQAAGRFHGIRAAVLLILFALLGWGAYELNGNLQAAALVNSLRTAKEDAVLGVIEQVGPYRRWADGRLRSMLASEPRTVEEQRAELRCADGVVACGASFGRGFERDVAGPGHGLLVRRRRFADALQPYQERFTGELWEILRATAERPERRFRAGLALAEYEPAADGWNEQDTLFLAEQLISANPEHQPLLREYLRPIGESLLAPLELLFRNQDLSETQQLGSANAYVPQVIEPISSGFPRGASGRINGRIQRVRVPEA